jgi:hypothetical protein
VLLKQKSCALSARDGSVLKNRTKIISSVPDSIVKNNIAMPASLVKIARRLSAQLMTLKAEGSHALRAINRLINLQSGP